MAFGMGGGAEGVEGEAGVGVGGAEEGALAVF